MRIIDIPIEPLHERYSIQWARWFTDYYTEYDIEYLTILGQLLTLKIEKGSFLDVCGTNYFKASQLMSLIEGIHAKEIHDDDVLFFHDLWFPGLEMLAYVRDGLGMKFKIAGCLHAGSYDPNDFLANQKMNLWAEDLENSWFKIVDRIYVATKYHRDLLCTERIVDYEKVKVTPFPIYSQGYNSVTKENIIVFPHRLDEEKRPGMFDRLKEKLSSELPDWQFLKTVEVCKDKREYYELLERSKIAVSFAWQETWGIAMQEAVFAGCYPVVPDRLSYREMYYEAFKIRSSMLVIDTYIDRIRNIINYPTIYANSLKSQKEQFQKQGETAISKIILDLGDL